MSLKTLLRNKAIDFTGYWMYKRTELPTGADIIEDLNYKIDIKLNTIFDVGSNVGHTVHKFAKSFPQARVYCFEPISATFDALKKRTRDLNNAEYYNIAFGDKVEDVDIKLFGDDRSSLNSLKPNSMNYAKEARVERIHVETIDNFLKEVKSVDSIDLLKIDTEGFELQVLKGASETLLDKKIKLIFLEVGFSKANERNSYFIDVQELLEQKNFTLLGYYEMCHIGIKNQSHYGNALYIHNDYLGKIKEF